MTQRIADYAETLRDLYVPQEAVEQTADIFEAVPQLKMDLTNPAVPLERKHSVIEKVFPEKIRIFLKILCDNDDLSDWDGIRDVFMTKSDKDHGVLSAVMRYVTPPREEQKKGIEGFLKRKFGAEEVALKLEHDPSLLGGFVLRAGNMEFDWSTKDRIHQLENQLINNSLSQSASSQGIISILKSEIDHFEPDLRDQEVGAVKRVGDSIAIIDGVDHAMYGEILLFDNGVKGMVQDIRRNELGCILFGSDEGIREGSRVTRTGKRAGIPVGEGFIGRIVDALGAPVDGKGDIRADGYRAVENEAPGIIDRKSVNVPLQTGILSIDAMFPIGRGQRELIIGDRQTGKTSIAIDTILNQKNKGVICIYAAIGQKASTVSKVVSTLERYGAMEYSIILLSTASDPASLQYMAPYSATALAEYFMYQGKDVLIVYDDLSKHAVAYRTLSLLLERSPGREAYPGDVFYLHSRLLERASSLRDELGGGSITALPIIETQAGDVSAYIPTNVISITDGQIFLESDLFFAGMRPAVNVGLSVSRVGGAAQTRAMKKASGTLRIDLAQYREMEVFSQFSADLDAATKEQLRYGSGLMELIKQPLYRPLSLHEQVISLYLANERELMKMDLLEIQDFQMDFLHFIDEEYSEIGREIEKTKDFTQELKEKVKAVLTEYRRKTAAESEAEAGAEVETETKARTEAESGIKI